MAALPRKYAVVGLVAVITLTIVMWGGYTGEKEARYAGGSMEAWFKDYRRAIFVNRSSADKIALALRGVGTNEVSYLLGEAFNNRSDSRLFRYLDDLGNYAPAYFHLPRWCSQEESRWAAVELMSSLKPAAGVVLPELSSPLRSSNLLWRMRALQILGNVGVQDRSVTHCLLTNLDDTTREICYKAAQSLILLHAPAGDVVPELAGRLRLNPGTQSEVRTLAILAVLDAYGEQAQPATTSLLAWLGPQDPNQPTDSLYEKGVKTLLQIGPNEKATIHFLNQRFENKTNWTLSDLSRSTRDLAKVGRNDAETLALLRKSFDTTTNWPFRCQLAVGVLTIDPKQLEAWQFLTNSPATREDKVRQQIAAALCDQIVARLNRAGN